MHQALILIARAIALAHDHWRRSIGRRLSLSGQLAVLEEKVGRLDAENALLRARLLRVPARRRPRYRAHEWLEILWNTARYRLSVTATAHLFAVTRQTVIQWRRALGDRSPSLLPPPGRLSDLVRELAPRLKAECGLTPLIRSVSIDDQPRVLVSLWYPSRPCFALRECA
jgi:hypothetical protein